VKPVDHDILLTAAQFDAIMADGMLERAMGGPRPLVRGYRAMRDHRFFVHLNADHMEAHRRDQPDDPLLDTLTTPYWFRVHVYYDVVSSQDYVVLTHGKPREQDAPVVRLQSDALFDRFPLRTVGNRDKLKQSLKHIVSYGSGAMLLLYNDGRGAGFGAHATDRMLTSAGQAASSEAAYAQLGVGYDSRDYDASIKLLQHHIPNKKIQMVMNSPASLVKKPEYAEALNRHHIDVENWIFLGDEESHA
jgi:3,4-dihydroxy 2-butanone 4-phosphate synthase / GTP cyclohydrolase II